MRRRRSWKSKATRLVQVDWRERALLAEASAQLLAARLRIAILPFRTIAKDLGTFVPPADSRIAAARAPAPEDLRHAAEKIGWAVTRAAVHVPFKAVCLPQAMAAHAMLKRRGIGSAVHFGARRSDEKPIDAHAWLDAAGVEVTGYPVAAGMKEIGAFV
ncbi:lasso peptide biosynthesis B2 protein [Sphingomonas sp. AOB5]|uniref:lasso peptide biosynthesis B2 protein n=1 Tax=Sphingomonas sp. AOB5 TaxID=3034017 RepID=UPI0023F981DF|nr:lasso peptide biosynthesis B2 protein [Sphingomonas sp. AOB5]MDF7775344.1 lasso peptide biosynthesis B2 protein [Sphingomonas sp. AOB5]